MSPVAFKSAIDDAVIAELRGIIGDDERVLDDLSSRAFRSRVPAPFPVHRWADHMPDVAVLLSPFDNLLWDRAFAVRLFRFQHLIEVYKPGPQRRFGYYVLPLLVGDRIVGRADLRSDRSRGVLRILAFHKEAGARRDAGRLEEAVGRLAADIGLSPSTRPEEP